MVLTYFVLPAYNEESSLGDLFEQIDKSVTNYQIILINDGSSDRTGEIAEYYSTRIPITILTHTTNQGLGTSLRTGINYLIRNGVDNSVVVTMDSDLTHDPKMVPHFIKIIDAGFDVVVASRYVKGGTQRNLPLSRVILSWGVNMLIRIHGSKVLDNTSGFRCIRLEALRAANAKYGNQFITSSGFVAAAEILIKLQSIGSKVREVPLRLDYGLKKSPSKLKMWDTITAYLTTLFNF